MEHRQLGKNGPQLSALGLGCMGMSHAYGPSDEKESLQVLHRYLELGGNFLDTAEVYGPYKNEELLGRFLREVPRDSVVVATKFGFRIGSDGTRTVDSSPENVRRACDESLRRLGIETIDLYYQHRVDPNVPIEETVGAMAELVSVGKVRTIGLSEAAPETLRRAMKVHPIAALQSEYSLWTREVATNGVLAACRELGITFVPYSPLGRGFLTGHVKRAEEYPSEDFRSWGDPRFQGANFDANLYIADVVREIAVAHGAMPAQVALAWVLGVNRCIVPIPGTKRRSYLEENLAAASLELTAEEIEILDDIAVSQAVSGARYNDRNLALLDRSGLAQ